MANSTLIINDVCCQQAALKYHQTGAKCKQHSNKKSKSHYYKSSTSLSASETPHSTSSSSSTSSTECLNNIDENNNNRVSSKEVEQTVSTLAAVKFKYQTNASQEDLCELRKLLIQERHGQIVKQMSNDEVEFYRFDYERMLVDDWLVTRFLLRGKKAYERLPKPSVQLDAIDSEQQIKHQIYLQTLELIKVCAKFRFDYQINKLTRESQFPIDWVKVNGLFEFEPDRVGNPTVYLRVALHRPKLIETPVARHEFKRYLLYTLERCDQKLFNNPGKAICCIFDMSNVAVDNIDLELTTWMIKSFKSCSPKLLCYVVIYNPPWFFTATFKLICNTLLSSSKRQSVKFAHGNEILQYITYDNLPQYLKSIIRRKQ